MDSPTEFLSDEGRRAVLDIDLGTQQAAQVASIDPPTDAFPAVDHFDCLAPMLA